ncbi:exo-alpha-sialidase [Emticicia sp. BO119]|uniref:sialidase family protein n=1 Tax=Emticicia sp. BO119 TaxID=2757768 RepID=UPI0015F06493|nr:sialidase family protein [Emticicia sp. BO119]MBA4853671.1 exo-alpha-sialidase [Emticicia sp. BO119]
MKKILLTLIISIGFYKINAQQTGVPVFTSGKEGHKSYRIPAIISLPDGQLLAIAEGRVNGSGDFGDINIVMKTSIDQGKTWSDLKTIVDYDSLQAGNPAPVFDNSDPAFPNGRIFLFYNTGNNHENEVRKGKGLREVWYKTSVDGGNTWGDGINITLQVHKPNQPQINPLYNFKEDWRSYANTPGHALQIQNGKYKGRIYVAANHSEGDSQKHAEDYFAHGFYSDDHGKTFKLSQTINIPGGNEATATEISGNGLILNARNQKGDKKARIVSISKDGGETWEKTYFDENLPDPVCEGSILSLGTKKGKHILAFSNAAHQTKRDNLTLRISFDEGKTWSINKVVDKSSNEQSKDYTAYSDIVRINKNTIGVLYEKDRYSQIVFTTVHWN